MQVPLAPLSALVLVSGAVDLTPPAAPTGLTVASDGPGSVSLAWTRRRGARPTPSTAASSPAAATSGSRPRRRRRSPTAASRTGQSQYYVVRALDTAGNESDPSNEVRALPHLAIDWSNLQWPPSASVHAVGERRPHRLRPGLHRRRDRGRRAGRRRSTHSSATARRARIRTRRRGRGRTPASTATPATTTSSWRRSTRSRRGATTTPTATRRRPAVTGSTPTSTGPRTATPPAQAGKLTVDPSGDTTAAPVPAGLHVTSSGPASISLAWDPVDGARSLRLRGAPGRCAGGARTRCSR